MRQSINDVLARHIHLALPKLPPAEIVARLVALNAERAAEEAAGHVRWLRPDYQVPRFAKPAGVR